MKTICREGQQHYCAPSSFTLQVYDNDLLCQSHDLSNNDVNQFDYSFEWDDNE